MSQEAQNQKSEPKLSVLTGVRNPNLWPEPNTIRHPELIKYVSLDMQKLQISYGTYKKSVGYIGGILLGCLVAKFFVDRSLKNYIFGANGNGGNLLKMYTKNSNDDYYYNREFQRMRYLSEEAVGDDPAGNTSEQLLVDLGINFPRYGINREVKKRAPHYKYFY